MGWSTTGLIFLYGLSLFQWLFIFCLGVFVQPFAQFALSRVSQNWLWDAIFLAGVGLFGVLCVDPSQLWAAAPAAVLITVGLYSDKGLGSALCGNPAALFLGRISYSLYLTHIMLMWIWPLYLGVTAPPLLTAQLPLAFAVAMALHFAFEKPARDWLRGAKETRQNGVVRVAGP
jgi:peptidoglycan/LPS O-acetylase OafA/YrhL